MNRDTTSIAVITIWFGTLPEYFRGWLLSVSHNPSIQFIFLTDCAGEAFEIPENMMWIETTPEHLRARFSSVLNRKVSFQSPMKFCGLKPIYGLAFSDLLNGYDFWGYCDIDLAFGDIRKFVTQHVLENYDRVYTRGHFNLYRNSDKINHLFELKGSIYSIEDVATGEFNFAFDEFLGINRICIKNRDYVRWYTDADFAECNYRSKYIELLFPHKNYDNQLFWWEDGCVYQSGIDEKGNIVSCEYVYLHWRHKLPSDVDIITGNTNGFYITEQGLKVKRDKGAPSRELLLRNHDPIEANKNNKEGSWRMGHKISTFIQLPSRRKLLRIKELYCALFDENPPYNDYRHVVFPRGRYVG